jgi:hypothetical protein
MNCNEYGAFSDFEGGEGESLLLEFPIVGHDVETRFNFRCCFGWLSIFVPTCRVPGEAVGVEAVDPDVDVLSFSELVFEVVGLGVEEDGEAATVIVFPIGNGGAFVYFVFECRYVFLGEGEHVGSWKQLYKEDEKAGAVVAENVFLYFEDIVESVGWQFHLYFLYFG